MTPDEVRNREDLVVFLGELAARLHRSPGSVPNATLREFLSGATGWVEDMDGYFLNRGEAVPDEPTWGLVASIFAAATVYE